MTEADYLKELAELRVRLEEAEETLRAIRSGEVDALVVGNRVFTLKSAETPYRVLVEAMNEVAVTLTPDGTVCYSNGRLSELLRLPHESVIGSTLRRFVAHADLPSFDALFAEAQSCSSRGEVLLERKDAPPVPVELSFSRMTLDAGTPGLCAIITNLTERKLAEGAMEQAKATLEQQIAERTKELREANAELSYFNSLMTGRELRMIDLKKEIDKLCRQFGQPTRYGYNTD